MGELSLLSQILVDERGDVANGELAVSVVVSTISVVQVFINELRDVVHGDFRLCSIVAQVVELPFADHLIVVGQYFGLGEADGDVAVRADVELELVEVGTGRRVQSVRRSWCSTSRGRSRPLRPRRG